MTQEVSERPVLIYPDDILVHGYTQVELEEMVFVVLLWILSSWMLSIESMFLFTSGTI